MPGPALPPGVTVDWLRPPAPTKPPAPLVFNPPGFSSLRPALAADQAAAAAAATPAPGTSATQTAAPAPGGTGVAAPGALGAPDQTYLASVNASAPGQALADLAQFGLQGQDATDAVNWFTQETNNLRSPAWMQIDMYKQPWFGKAFPGIIQQIANGQTPMTPQDYITFKQGVKSFSSQFGLPPGFVTDADVGNMVGRGWTFDTFTQRVGLAFNASAGAAAANPEAVSLLDKWYGIKPGSGALAAFYLDPTKAVTTLANATTAAQIGASAETAGFTHIDQNTLMSLAAHGVTADQGKAAAGQLAPVLGTTRAMQGPGAGQPQPGVVTEQDLLASQLGNVPGETQEQAQQRVQTAEGVRTAAFHGGGGNVNQGAPGKPTGAGYGTM